MRVVLDTNVWVSALLSSSGRPARIVGAVADGTLAAASTAHLWAELIGALAQGKVRRALEQTGRWDLAQAVMSVARQVVTFVPDVSPEMPWVAADPDDDWVIQCALTAGATWIVSGDRQLVALGTVGSVAIVTPATFVADVLDQKH